MQLKPRKLSAYTLGLVLVLVFTFNPINLSKNQGSRDVLHAQEASNNESGVKSPLTQRMPDSLQVLPQQDQKPFPASEIGEKWSDCPSLGAFRWDAYHGIGEVGDTVEAALAPPQWHFRVPFCGKIEPDNKVVMECARQETMDQEIKYAADAGLQFWIFPFFHEENPMSLALSYYLKSDKKSLMKFSLMTNPKNWGWQGNPQKAYERYIALMNTPSYMKVASGRPLFFIGFINEKHMQGYVGGEKRLRDSLKDFRKMAIEKGLGNPYIVCLDFNPEKAKQLAEFYEFDAISTYATHGGAHGGAYSELVTSTEHYWERSRRTGAKMVPIVSTGWDDRPRAYSPVGWFRPFSPPVYYEKADPQAISKHLGDAITWVRRNPDACEIKTIVIYAWNENVEGGWLIPTLKDGNSRLLAIAKKLKEVCPTH